MRIDIMLLALVSLFSCRGEQALKNEALEQQVTIGDFSYTARYLPIRQQALKEVDFEVKDMANFLKILKETEGHHYVHLKISPSKRGQSLQALYESRGAEKDWQTVVMDLNFNYQKQFELHQSEDRFACKLYHAFPGINAQDGIQFLLVFKDDMAVVNRHFAQDLSLKVNDTHLSKKQISIVFSKSALNKIPKLKI